MIGIVGGGMAGLAAAHRLQEAGREVRIFEASDSLGGLAATYPTDGNPVERFYHHLSRTEETIVELAEDLGVGDRIEWRVGKNAYYVGGEVHPLDTPLDILRFPPLSLYDKFRLAMLTQGVDVRGGRPRRSTYDDLEAFEDVGVREFVVEHTTEAVYERFFDPLLEAKFGSRKEDVSAAWLLGRIRFRGERDLLRGEILGYVDGGFAALVDALVEAVGREAVALGSTVEDLRTRGGAVTALEVAKDGSTSRVDVDEVVVATMPNVLEALTGYTCGIDFQGTVCSLFSLDEPLLDTYWLNLADETTIGALIEHTNFVEPERYGGEHLLYAARYVQDPDDPVWGMGDDEVASHWTGEIDRLFEGFDPSSVRRVRTARNPRTAPIYERGYLEKVVPYDLGHEVADGLYYAGMATRAQYPERSLDGAVEAGFAAAHRILDR